MMRRLLHAAVCVIGFCAADHALAYTAPQDQWRYESDQRWYLTSPYGIAVDTGAVYVTAGHYLYAFDKAGGQTARWGSQGTGTNQFQDPRGLAVTETRIYVADHSNNRIQVLSKSGDFLFRWGAVGSALGQLYQPIGIDTDGEYVYVAEYGNNRISVFTLDGTPVRCWGSAGTLPGQFSAIRDVAVDRSAVYAADLRSSSITLNRRVQVFSKTGQYLREWVLADTTDYGPWGIAVDSSYVYATFGGKYFPTTGYWYGGFSVYTKAGTQVARYTTYTLVQSDGPHYSQPFAYPKHIAVLSPYIYVTENVNGQIVPYRQLFRSLGSVRGIADAIPLSEVVAQGQRLGTSILDVDFVVDDADATHVTAYALAFKPGTPALDKVVPIRTLVDGTAANVGTNVTVGATNRLSWDVSADWTVDYGDVRIAILAKDSRNLLDLHFLHMPPVGTNSALVINQVPLLANDLLNLWFWVLASRDARVRLDNGNVYGVGGDYDGQALTSGGVTTAAGRAFLFAYAGVREATVDEVQRAREAGTPGSVTKWTPRLTLPDGRPTKINEFGFDTGSTNGWWVVPLD